MLVCDEVKELGRNAVWRSGGRVEWKGGSGGGRVTVVVEGW